MMGKTNEERLMEMYEESEAEKRILCEKIDRTVAELTATRKKLVIIAEILEELAEKYDVGKDVVKSIIAKMTV